jgi:hypothetical protein
MLFSGSWAIKTDEEKEWYEDLGTRTVPVTVGSVFFN